MVRDGLCTQGFEIRIQRRQRKPDAKDSKGAKETKDTSSNGNKEAAAAKPAAKKPAAKKTAPRGRAAKKTRYFRADQIYSRLQAAYPDAKCALNHDNALQLLVATIFPRKARTRW